MTTKTTLAIPQDPSSIPHVSPNLMPFHIAYSGPAPISTYFLKKPYVDPSMKEEGGASSKSKEGEISNTEEERVVAAFRGRRVVSHSVKLPDGYTGLLLQPSISSGNAEKDVQSKDEVKPTKGKVADAKAKAAARAKALKAKAAKLKRKSRHVEDEEEEEENLEEEEEEQAVVLPPVVVGGEKREEKVLAVAGQFKAFELWHPDVPVDEGQDVYIRSLNEWITLTSEIHRI